MEDIAVRWKCPTCDVSHLQLVPGNAKDVLSLKLRCPGCASESALCDSVQEVRPEHRTRRWHQPKSTSP